MPVVGLLSSRSPATDAHLIAIIRQGLNETGFAEGQNVAFDYRWTEGHYDRLAGLAADLVRRQVAVIVTMGGEPSALAAKAATATIPIVFVGSTDPVRSGLVTSLHRPGGNITGASLFHAEIEPKRLGLLRELRPNATTIVVLVNPNGPYAETQVNDTRAAASSVGQEITILNASTIGEIDAAFARLAQMRADALFVATDPFFFDRATQLVVLAEAVLSQPIHEHLSSAFRRRDRWPNCEGTNAISLSCRLCGNMAGHCCHSAGNDLQYIATSHDLTP
jgi:putative tryptophan/tyrosine transport system substrate-binding protein